MQYNKLIKNTRIIVAVIVLIMILMMTACISKNVNTIPEAESTSSNEVTATVASKTEETTVQEISSGQIYLYGELHGCEKIMEREFELWYEYYHNEGLRHLFIEVPYYAAEFLNLWMKSDNDEILDNVYNDWQGTAAYNPYIKAFYKRIKRECPETVFHGTDVGHQYATTGERFLNYLQKNHLENSEQYKIAQEVIEQGKYYYTYSDGEYRENKMVENFIHMFNALDGESIMGIYGSAHIGIEEMNAESLNLKALSMASQLYAFYGDAIHTEDLSWIGRDIKLEPERMDTITIAEKEYQAAYFGKENITGIKDFVSREFWRLENAYDDFKDYPKTGNVLPHHNYPMPIETGQVFMLELEKADGSILRVYYRSDEKVWNTMPLTEEFTIE